MLRFLQLNVHSMEACSVTLFFQNYFNHFSFSFALVFLLLSLPFISLPFFPLSSLFKILKKQPGKHLVFFKTSLNVMIMLEIC